MVNVLLAGRAPDVVFLQQNISRINERPRVGFHQSQWDQPLPNAKYLVQATCLGSDTTDSAGSFFSRGVTMKRTIFAGVLLTVGFSLPILAQQQDLQDVMNAANALGARESELL